MIWANKCILLSEAPFFQNEINVEWEGKHFVMPFFGVQNNRYYLFFFFYILKMSKLRVLSTRELWCRCADRDTRIRRFNRIKFMFVNMQVRFLLILKMNLPFSILKKTSWSILNICGFNSGVGAFYHETLALFADFDGRSEPNGLSDGKWSVGCPPSAWRNMSRLPQRAQSFFPKIITTSNLFFLAVVVNVSQVWQYQKKKKIIYCGPKIKQDKKTKTKTNCVFIFSMFSMPTTIMRMEMLHFVM